MLLVTIGYGFPAAAQFAWSKKQHSCSSTTRMVFRRDSGKDSAMTKLPPSVTIHVQKNLCHWYLWHISIISYGLRHLLTTFNQPVAVWFAHSSAVFAPVILFSFRFPSCGHVLEASDQRSNIFLRVSSISQQSCVRYLALVISNVLSTKMYCNEHKGSKAGQFENLCRQ